MCDGNDNTVNNGLVQVYAGSNNTVYGCGAFVAGTGASANDNTVLGTNALANATVPSGNTIIGSGALTNHTSATLANNVIVGLNAGNTLINASSNNVAVGANAMGSVLANYARNNSVAIGVNALATPTDGLTQTNDVAIGYNCNAAPGLDNNVTLGANATCRGGNSVAIGVSCNVDPTSTECVCIGKSANIGGGDGNVLIGGLGFIPGPDNHHNVVIGGRTGAGQPSNVATADYTVVIGVNARATGDNAIALGTGVTAITAFGLFTYKSLAPVVSGTTMLHDPITGQIGPMVSSQRYKTNIAPLADSVSSRIWDLQPRSFNYIEGGKADFGYIAEEVATAVPELVVSDNLGPKSVRYEMLSVLLLAELKKLEARVGQLENK